MKMPVIATATESSVVEPAVGEANSMQKIADLVEKKIRNLEKRRLRLVQLSDDEKAGKVKLTDEQVEALSRLREVDQMLELAREIGKTVHVQLKDSQRLFKENLKRDARQRQATEILRLKEFLQYQEIVNLTGKASVREALAKGQDGTPVLSELELNLCDAVYGVLCPSMEGVSNDEQWQEKLSSSAETVYQILVASTKPVLDSTTGKDIKALIDKIAHSHIVRENRATACEPPTTKAVDESIAHMPESDAEQLAAMALINGHMPGGQGNEVAMVLPSRSANVVFVNTANGYGGGVDSQWTPSATIAGGGGGGVVDMQFLSSASVEFVRSPPSPIPLPESSSIPQPTNEYGERPQRSLPARRNNEAHPGNDDTGKEERFAGRGRPYRGGGGYRGGPRGARGGWTGGGRDSGYDGNAIPTTRSGGNNGSRGGRGLGSTRGGPPRGAPGRGTYPRGASGSGARSASTQQ